MFANPDTDRWKCPSCGRNTRVNLRTGLSYSHTVPGSNALCEMSAVPVVPPAIDGQAPELDRPEKTPQVTQPRRYYDGVSTSVRTISAGIPGSQRRR